MRIDHIGLFVDNLGKAKSFYEKYFAGNAGQKYHNPTTGFTSYFISFGDGCRLELMNKPDLSRTIAREHLGFAHISFSMGSKEAVDELTARLASEGYEVISGPRTTGDGYYESRILDPEGNIVEITE